MQLMIIATCENHVEQHEQTETTCNEIFKKTSSMIMTSKTLLTTTTTTTTTNIKC